MNKIVLSFVTAMVLTGIASFSAAPAEAQRYRDRTTSTRQTYQERVRTDRFERRATEYRRLEDRRQRNAEARARRWGQTRDPSSYSMDSIDED